MLAHKLFFTIMLTIVVNYSSILCMQQQESPNKISSLEEYAQILGEEKMGFLFKPLPQLQPLEELPETEESIAMQEITRKILTLKEQIKKNPNQTKNIQKHKSALKKLLDLEDERQSLWEQEIGLEIPRKSSECSVSINFENNTQSALHIAGKTIKPKEKVQIDSPLLNLTNRLTICSIPIYSTTQIELWPIGTTLCYQKNSMLGTIEIMTDKIDETPEYFLHAQLFIGNKENPESSEFKVCNARSYFGQVILENDKKTQNLQGTMSIDTNLYAAALEVQRKQHSKVLTPAIAVANSTQESSEVISNSPLMVTMKNVSAAASPAKPKESINTSQSSTYVDKKTANNQSASNGEEKTQRIVSNATLSYATLRSKRSEKPIGNICTSQSTTNIKDKKPAFPAPKNSIKTGDESETTEHKQGNLILLKNVTMRAIKRTGSLINVREEIP